MLLRAGVLVPYQESDEHVLRHDGLALAWIMQEFQDLNVKRTLEVVLRLISYVSALILLMGVRLCL